MKSFSINLSSFFEIVCAFWSNCAHKSFVFCLFIFWRRTYNQSVWSGLLFFWMSLWAVFSQTPWEQPHYPSSSSQSILLSKTSAKSASSCQSNQSSNLSCNSRSTLGGWGVVWGGRCCQALAAGGWQLLGKSPRQNSTETNFNKILLNKCIK